MITYPISSNLCKKSFSASIFLVPFFIEDFFLILFQQKNEIKKGNALMELKYLPFCSSTDLFGARDVKFKRNLTDGNLIRKFV